jgi:hypothetical protein
MKKKENNTKLCKTLFSFLFLTILLANVHAQKFEAIGPTSPERTKPEEFIGVVKVTFDKLPTTMSFDLPWRYNMVTENNINVSSLAAETYDPRHFDHEALKVTGSFEPGTDKEGRYVRAWIEHQSDARIVVRVRYALNNALYDIAHPDIPSGSPYGKGDWADEWHYIYPDGTNIRHMKIYTGLAPESRPFGWKRSPPNNVYEFMEVVVTGPLEHVPTDDIDINALTLIRIFGGHTESFIDEGISKLISYDPYPQDFGEFRDANIMVVNTKSEYKPFIIGMPYGVRVQPYWASWAKRFINWGEIPGVSGYNTPLCHMINYWNYRRTDNTLEQIYLQGMTNAADPQKELVPLAWSWIDEPNLRMEGIKSDYKVYTYDPAQKAYIVPKKGLGPAKLEFSLVKGSRCSIINPTFIVKNWDEEGVRLKVDDKEIYPGEDFRIGMEETPTGKDLVLWVKMSSTKSTKFEISPK